MGQTSIIIILSLLILGNRTSQDKEVVGTYFKSWGFSSVTIELKSDGEYSQVNSGCTHDLYFVGTWELKADTIRLCQREMGYSKSKDMQPWYSDTPDFLLLTGDQLTFLNCTDSGKFITDNVLCKTYPDNLEYKKTKRKVRKK